MTPDNIASFGFVLVLIAVARLPGGISLVPRGP